MIIRKLIKGKPALLQIKPANSILSILFIGSIIINQDIHNLFYSLRPMFLLLFLSIVLLILYISSLRFMIKTSNSYIVQKEIQKIEDYMSEEQKNIAPSSLSMILSLSVIIILNLIEIGYFVYSNYFFNDLVITLGSAILIGYTVYSMIQFLPRIKKFISKPLMYLKEKSQGFETVLNFIMVSLEIVFCLYIMFKIFINFILIG